MILLFERIDLRLRDSGFKHHELTHRIIRCAMKVHRVIGYGFQEVTYQRAMRWEMERAGLSFGRESDMPVIYEGVQIGTRRVDFFVGDVVLVELKAVSGLDDLHLAQGINYLEAFGLEVGLLLNFGGTKLEIRRLVNSLNRGC